MTGLHTINRGGENSYGANLEVYNSTSPTAICFGIKAFTGPDYQCVNCKPAKNYASNFIANQGQEVYGAYIEANDGSVKNYGILAITNSNNSYAADYYGVSGIVNVTYAVNKPKNSYGGNFVSTGATNESFGVKAVALGGDNMNYAVYASVAGSGCTSSSGCNNWAGYFNGSTFSSGLYLPSDSNLKRNIKSIPNALSLINQLNPKEFNYKKSIFNQLSLPEGEHYGFLAQDVQTTLPGLVKETRQPAILDSAGNVIKHGFNFLAINYEEIIPLLVDVVQQQQLQIDSLINGMAANNQPKMVNPNSIEVTLSNQSKIILNQNDPNPFAENTTINYFIPDNITVAQLLFYDNTGTVLKTIDIKEKGQGSILVYGSNLSSGIYTYTLLANGKVIETKRMVKVK